LKEPISPIVTKSIKQSYDAIETQLTVVAKDLQGINAYRYSKQISWGLQEFMEAVTFRHYLETQCLMSYQEAQANVETMTKDGKVMLIVDDYVLGLFDMVGELMRFAITVMATNGELPGKDGRDVLSDLRELRASLESLETDKSSWFCSDVSKKMPVMQECVEKVEKALYGLTVRGAERPKGWMPDADESRGDGEDV
jgi:predicted translin family RNA/ssDNA-binding protein